MMLVVVLFRIDLFDFCILVKNTAVDAVVFAVFLAAVLAKTAELADLKSESFRASLALIAKPLFADTALAAVISIVFTAADFLHALFAYGAVLPAVFAKEAGFTVFDLGSARAGAAVFADVLAAVSTVFSAVRTLTGLGVTFAEVGAVITVVRRAVKADAARIAKLGSRAERTLVAFGADEFFIALNAVLAAIRKVGFHIGIGVFEIRADNDLFAVRTNDVEFVFLHFFNAFVASHTLWSLMKLDAVFASHTYNAMREVAVRFVNAVLSAFRAVEIKLRCTQHTGATFLAITVRAVFAYIAVEAYFYVFVFRVICVAKSAVPAVGVNAYRKEKSDCRN